MLKIRWGKSGLRRFDSQSGMTLIEVLIAMALLTIIGILLLDSTATASRAAIVSTERVSVESYAKSQMAYVLAADFVDGEAPYPKDPDPLLNPEGYQANVDVVALQDGLQKITVTVYLAADQPLMILEAYKKKPWV